MAFKMKSPYGKGSHDTSSSHGTNSNYGKSGAPSMLGNILTGGMLGLGKKLMGKGKGRPCPPGQGFAAQGTPGNPPPQPAAPAPAAAAPVTPAPEEQQVAGAMMKKELKTGAPMAKKEGAPMAKKAGAPLANPNPKDLRRKDKAPVPSKPMTAEQKMKMEKMAGKKMKKAGAPKLKGGQHKIDMNKDGKISKADFDMMNKKGAPMAKKGAPMYNKSKK